MSVKNSVCVIIPIYGNLEYWQPMADNAAKSVDNQTVKATSVIVSIGKDIADARNNAGLLKHDCEYIIFLDADDELHPSYIEEMLKLDGDIRVPAVHRHYKDGRIDTDQHWYTPKDLMTGNYIVIGAMIRSSLFKLLGGFDDYESLEDWDLWLRAEESGAIFEQRTGAIYKAYRRVGSRNSNKSLNEILENAKKRRGI